MFDQLSMDHQKSDAFAARLRSASHNQIQDQDQSQNNCNCDTNKS
jgi:hypothetical protein